YETPSYSTKYSKHYFDSLTFRQCVDLYVAPPGTHPYILRPKCLISFHFDAEVPTSEEEIIVVAAENIPHIADLLEVTKGLESAYDVGAHAVWLDLSVNGHRSSVRYHFSKLRLVINICNNFPHIKNAAEILLHIEESGILHPHWIELFGTEHIHATIHGFQVTQYPLHKLSCLLGENWVEDDVGDSITELAYLRLASFTPGSASSPFLLLPVS
ncbi:hypothetical protein DFH07DRAFT_711052, partial [Mycena maculata]